MLVLVLLVLVLTIAIWCCRSLAATFANMRYGGVEHAKKALSKDIVIIKAIDAVSITTFHPI